jgi:hypothetical protein
MDAGWLTGVDTTQWGFTEGFRNLGSEIVLNYIGFHQDGTTKSDSSHPLFKKKLQIGPGAVPINCATAWNGIKMAYS